MLRGCCLNTISRIYGSVPGSVDHTAVPCLLCCSSTDETRASGVRRTRNKNPPVPTNRSIISRQQDSTRVINQKHTSQRPTQENQEEQFRRSDTGRKTGARVVRNHTGQPKCRTYCPGLTTRTSCSNWLVSARLSQCSMTASTISSSPAFDAHRSRTGRRYRCS